MSLSSSPSHRHHSEHQKSPERSIKKMYSVAVIRHFVDASVQCDFSLEEGTNNHDPDNMSGGSGGSGATNQLSVTGHRNASEIILSPLKTNPLQFGNKSSACSIM
eukprot:CAMPEP_0182434226 /NCGR_PEP_ID=MMETSP1167-20130531/68541_1 /TAXON_ID=2988 /ORGANISM="Mallomonas Sp, Strain CCMP3275" /LENGTH=104 /DNA_ID=CAMNT_0024623859 /DNA_START=196 /DNA_END=510 /DNA_ORIENTATION=-